MYWTYNAILLTRTALNILPLNHRQIPYLMDSGSYKRNNKGQLISLDGMDRNSRLSPANTRGCTSARVDPY